MESLNPLVSDEEATVLAGHGSCMLFVKKLNLVLSFSCTLCWKGLGHPGDNPSPPACGLSLLCPGQILLCARIPPTPKIHQFSKKKKFTEVHKVQMNFYRHMHLCNQYLQQVETIPQQPPLYRFLVNSTEGLSPLPSSFTVGNFICSWT